MMIKHLQKFQFPSVCDLARWKHLDFVSIVSLQNVLTGALTYSKLQNACVMETFTCDFYFFITKVFLILIEK